MRLVLSLVAATLVACSASNREPQRVCEPDPEGATAQRVAKNGTGLSIWDSQGREMNGTRIREGQGTELAGVHLQTQTANGWGQAMSLNGSELAGADLRGEAVVGSEIEAATRDGAVVRLKITSMERDADDPRLVRYALEHEGKNVCAGDAKGIFVAGVWDARGGLAPSTDAAGKTLSATFSCPTGVIEKCVRWGYKPWTVGGETHHACTRMARADYCGDGVSHTKDGTLIDVFDVRGVASPEGDASYRFEAGWGTKGAVCVSRTRYDATTPSGAQVLPSCWKDLPRCESWQEAQSKGATLGNASQVQSRVLCD